MRTLSTLLLLCALVALLNGAAWPWVSGLLAAGLLVRPGVPWLGVLFGAIVGLS